MERKQILLLVEAVPATREEVLLEDDFAEEHDPWLPKPAEQLKGLLAKLQH
jgi:hypothetical protein